MIPTLDATRAERASVRWPSQMATLIITSWAIAAAAHVRIFLPWSPVPITGQTLAIAVAGIALGPRRGFSAVALYLLQGGAGLPIFAGGTSGLTAFTGPTAGYLLAMPIGAALAGSMASSASSVGALRRLTAMLASSGVVLLFGSVWLSRYVHGFQTVLWAGLLPFIPGEAIKALIGSGVMQAFDRFRRT